MDLLALPLMASFAPRASERLRLAIRESQDIRRHRFLDFNESVCKQLAAGAERSDIAVATYRRKDGSTFPVEVRRTVHDTSEGPILVVNARDLSERNSADERQAAQMRYHETLARFGQAALGKREPNELVAEAIQAVVDGLGADAVAYLEPGQQPGELVLREGRGYDVGLMAAAPGSAVEAALASSEPFVGSGSALPFAWGREFGSVAVVAVRGDNTVRGALCVLARRDDAFWADEIAFLRTAASVLSTGLRRIDSER